MSVRPDGVFYYEEGEYIMTVYDELVARGLIAQVTDEEEIKELINNGKATFYIGFDPTADSLHNKKPHPNAHA